MIMKATKELKITGGAMAVMMPDMSLSVETANMAVHPVAMEALPVALVPVLKDLLFPVHRRKQGNKTNDRNDIFFRKSE